jgi:uncharacterized Zn-finger protein
VHAQSIYKKTSLPRTSTSNEIFNCDYRHCNKFFSRSCDLRRHKKTHVRYRERPFACDICRDAFLYKKDLLRHCKVAHKKSIKILQYQCPVSSCGRANRQTNFTNMANLKRHMNVVHPGMQATANEVLALETYDCDYCRKPFGRKDNRDRHAARCRSIIKNYTCTCMLCGQRFLNRSKWVEHGQKNQCTVNLCE